MNARSNFRREAGATLLELVVAASLFALVVGSAAGIFVTFTRGERSQTGRVVLLGDIQTFLELLEREVRTGYANTFRCEVGPLPGTGGDPCADDVFIFNNQQQDEITYRHDAANASITRQEGAGAAAQITSRAVAVRDLEFTVQQSRVDAGPPPILKDEMGRVIVRLRACPPAVDDERCIHVQTTLTSRQYAPYEP